MAIHDEIPKTILVDAEAQRIDRMCFKEKDKVFKEIPLESK